MIDKEEIKISLEDFPDDIYIQLKDDFRAEFFKTAWKINKSYRHLARKIGISNTTMLSLRRGKDTVKLDRAISIKRLKDILIHCKESENPIFDINIIQKHVEYIRAKHGMKIYDPKLPIGDSIELREIVIHLICDGSALVEKHKTSKYALTDLNAVEEFKTRLSIFGSNPNMQITARKYNNHYKMCYILGFSKAITYILANKFKIDFRGTKARFPQEFFRGKRKLLIAIVRAFLIDEGCIRDRIINFCSGSKELLEDLSKICSLLNYKCQIIRKSGGTYYLNISPDSFIKVYADLTLLGELPIPEKQERLELGMKILSNSPNFTTLDEQILINLEEWTTTFELSKKLLVNAKTIAERLNRLQKQNLVQRNVTRNLGKGGSFNWKIL